jgi:hypothetical protein
LILSYAVKPSTLLLSAHQMSPYELDKKKHGRRVA